VVAGLLGTIATNDNTSLSEVRSDAEQLDQQYYLTIVGTAALLVGWIFVPEISEFFTSNDVWGVLYVTSTVVAQVALGWML
jgi:hypothetical protein